LKKKYGTGFKIAVSCDAKDNAKVSQSVFFLFYLFNIYSFSI